MTEIRDPATPGAFYGAALVAVAVLAALLLFA